MPKLFAASMTLGRGGLRLAAPAASSFDSAAYVAESAVAYWTMVSDGFYTQSDQTGRGNDLLFSALFDDPFYTAGKLGQSWNSPGVGDYFSRATTGDLRIGEGDFIVAVWVKLASKPENPPSITSKPAESRLGYESPPIDRFAWYVGDGAGSVQADTFGSPSTGTWHLVVARLDAVNQMVSIRVNNGALDSNGLGDTPVASANDFYIGAFDNTGGIFHGLIDDTLILKSDDALSADDFDALCDYLWNGGAGRDLSGLF